MVTYDGSTTKSYVNGVEKNFVYSSGFCGQNTGCLVIGQEQDSLCGGFSAVQAASFRLDSLRIHKFLATGPAIASMLNYDCIGAFEWHSNWAFTSLRLDEASRNHKPYQCDAQFNKVGGSCSIHAPDRAWCLEESTQVKVEDYPRNGTWVDYGTYMENRVAGLRNSYIHIPVKCTAQTNLQLQGLVLSPNSGTDSFFVRGGHMTADGKYVYTTSKLVWHTGHRTTYAWSTTSPSIPLAAGIQVVGLINREPTKIQDLKIVGGACKFLDPRGGTLGKAQMNKYISFGKKYFEVTLMGYKLKAMIGMSPQFDAFDNRKDVYPGYTSGTGYGLWTSTGRIYENGATTSLCPSIDGLAADKKVVGVAVDFESKKTWWSIDGTWCGGGNPSTGSGGYAWKTQWDQLSLAVGRGDGSFKTDVRVNVGCRIFQHDFNSPSDGAWRLRRERGKNSEFEVDKIEDSSYWTWRFDFEMKKRITSWEVKNPVALVNDHNDLWRTGRSRDLYYPFDPDASLVEHWPDLYEFDGTNRYEVPSASKNLMTTAFSLCIWFKYTGDNPTDWIRLIGKGSGSNRHYGLWINPKDNYLLTQTYGDTGSDQLITGKYKKDTWTHFCGTYTKNGFEKGYVDGVATTSVATTGTPHTTTDPVTMGFAPTLHTSMVGYLADGRIYNRELSATEIAQMSQIGSGEGLQSVVLEKGGDYIRQSMPVIPNRWFKITFRAKSREYSEKSCAQLPSYSNPYAIWEGRRIFVTPAKVEFKADEKLLNDAYTATSNAYRQHPNGYRNKKGSMDNKAAVVAKLYPFLGVWDRLCASIGSSCQSAKTFAQAESYCKGTNGRLCRIDEVDRFITTGTGCSFDYNYVWSSSVCGVSSAGVYSYWQQYGDKGYNTPDLNTAHKKRCVAATTTANVRCCADKYDPQSGINEGRIDVVVDGTTVAKEIRPPKNKWTKYSVQFKAEKGNRAVVEIRNSFTANKIYEVHVDGVEVRSIDTPLWDLQMSSSLDTAVDGVTTCAYHTFACTEMNKKCGCRYDLYPSDEVYDAYTMKCKPEDEPTGVHHQKAS
eukprot:jgi/Bigna1/87711/estExt_fgenesh1_pg.C_230113